MVETESIPGQFYLGLYAIDYIHSRLTCLECATGRLTRAVKVCGNLDYCHRMDENVSYIVLDELGILAKSMYKCQIPS